MSDHLDLDLPAKVLAIETALAAIPHAFGGAIALGYYAEPRGTIDIDLNVFVHADRFAEVLAALEPLGVTDGPGAATGAERDGFARIAWGRTPIDLFFSYDPFHDAAARASRVQPFRDGTITVLSPEHLIVCKAIFDRPKDWVDIDAIRADGTAIDAAEALRWVGRIAGDSDRRFDRLVAVLTS